MGRNPAGLGYRFTCECTGSREVAAACPSLVALDWKAACGTVRRLGGESHKCDFSSLDGPPGSRHRCPGRRGLCAPGAGPVWSAGAGCSVDEQRGAPGPGGRGGGSSEGSGCSRRLLL